MADAQQSILVSSEVERKLLQLASSSTCSRKCEWVNLVGVRGVESIAILDASLLPSKIQPQSNRSESPDPSSTLVCPRKLPVCIMELSIRAVSAWSKVATTQISYSSHEFGSITTWLYMSARHLLRSSAACMWKSGELLCKLATSLIPSPPTSYHIVIISYL